MAAVVGMDSGEVVAPESGKMVMQSARLVSLAASHWGVLDLRHRRNCKDLKSKILDLHRIVEEGSLVNKMSAKNRSGSYRTAKEAS